MNEVEKMYSNCNIKPKQNGYCDWDCDCPYINRENIYCNGTCPYWKIEKVDYPSFTAKKQLELSKWILSYWLESLKLKSYEEKLATFINRIWHEIPEFEQKRIMEILK